MPKAIEWLLTIEMCKEYLEQERKNMDYEWNMPPEVRSQERINTIANLIYRLNQRIKICRKALGIS